MDSHEELLALAERLRVANLAARDPAFEQPIERLRAAFETVNAAFCGSWLGYHANVFYAGLRPAPPGAHFSQEWGLERLYSGMGSVGAWEEFDPAVVRGHLLGLAGDPDLAAVEAIAERAAKTLEAAKSDALSILHHELTVSPDTFLEGLKLELEGVKATTPGGVIDYFKPAGQIMTRDMIAMGQGLRVPSHYGVLADIMAPDNNVGICGRAADILVKAGSHLERKHRRAMKTARIGTNVFIGHGRSGAWRELKDFVNARLGLPWDEFNRVPVAGLTNITRLSEMLDAAAIALLVMTAEDEMADGGVQARMNVVHEAGLFQGRLGFTRAIVLLEEGCSEFSNIQGLGQIRFPKGRISAAFEDVRLVLEREGLIGGS
jgi:hypothetical protein